MSKIRLDNPAGKFLSQVDKTDNSMKEPEKVKKELKQRSYYITDEQFKAIKIRALEEETNTSKIVRDAINKYLGLKD